MTLPLDHLETLAREATRGEWESVATRYATEKFDVCGPAGTLAIGRAGEAERLVDAARRRLDCVAESMTEHAYQELASALDAPPRPR